MYNNSALHFVLLRALLNQKFHSPVFCILSEGWQSNYDRVASLEDVAVFTYLLKGACTVLKERICSQGANSFFKNSVCPFKKIDKYCQVKLLSFYL